MASLTINAFYANGDAVGSSNVELNEGRLPVAAIKERFSAEHGLILDRPDGVLLVADHTGFSTRTFTAPGTVNVFLPLPPRPPPPLPKPVEQAEEFSLKMDWMQLLQFAWSEAHARIQSLFVMLHNLCKPAMQSPHPHVHACMQDATTRRMSNRPVQPAQPAPVTPLQQGPAAAVATFLQLLGFEQTVPYLAGTLPLWALPPLPIAPQPAELVQRQPAPATMAANIHGEPPATPVRPSKADPRGLGMCGAAACAAGRRAATRALTRSTRRRSGQFWSTLGSAQPGCPQHWRSWWPLPQPS